MQEENRIKNGPPEETKREQVIMVKTSHQELHTESIYLLRKWRYHVRWSRKHFEHSKKDHLSQGVQQSRTRETIFKESHLFATHLSPTLLKHWDLLDETYQTRLLQSDIENISFYV